MSALALLLVLAAPPLPGGEVLREHLPNVLETARVGEWVTYYFGDGAGRDYYWRVAVVGEEPDKLGRPAVWVEVDVGTHFAMKAPIAQMKMLASRAQGLTKTGVTRLFVAFGLERPREVAPEELPRVMGGEKSDPALPPPPPELQVKVKKGEPTRLVTLGGTVTATPIELRVRDTLFKRVWLADAIPILKLAKIEFPAVQHSMEARDWGLDAKPQMAPPEAGAATIRMEGVK